MSLFQKSFGWAVLASELGHVFCCVLPTVFTVLSFAANIGLIGAAPEGLVALHEFIHGYEWQVIAFSGAMVVFGWAVHAASLKVDCHDTGCVHEPCDRTKQRNARILTVATALFVVNLGIYLIVHQNVLGLSAFEAASTELHDHGHEDHHGHEGH
jgi:hypothetical protein